jgi:DNA polymerase
MNISEIRDLVIKCTKCELCKTRTNAVPGKGNPNAKIVFIGEAPGRTEDARGEPFVGAAGKKLGDALAKNGLDRDSVYITNVVKCRPPNNRVPNDSERQACRAYLDFELDMIKPEIICVLGNTASNSVLGQGEITKNRGKIIQQNGKKYFLTFHPAAIIYNQELATIFEQDIATLASLIQK